MLGDDGSSSQDVSVVQVPCPTSPFRVFYKGVSNSDGITAFCQQTNRDSVNTRMAIRTRVMAICASAEQLQLPLDDVGLTIGDTTMEEWSRMYLKGSRGRRMRIRMVDQYGEARIDDIERLCEALRKLLKLLIGSTQLAHKTAVQQASSSSSSSKSVPSKGPPLSKLPPSLQQVLNTLVNNSAWLQQIRARIQAQKDGRICNDKCMFALEPIPQKFQMFEGVPRSGASSSSSTPTIDWYLHDVRVLYGKSIQTNPLTRLKFSRAFMDLYTARAKRLRRHGYSLATELTPNAQMTAKREREQASVRVVPTPENVRQLMFNVVFALNASPNPDDPESGGGFLVELSSLEGLTDQELADWYHHCFEILTWRSELTFHQQREILPTGSIFEHHTTIRRDRWRQHHTSLQLRYEVWSMMHRMLTSAQVSHQRETGAHYVIMALTLCSEAFRSHEQFRVFAEAAAVPENA